MGLAFKINVSQEGDRVAGTAAQFGSGSGEPPSSSGAAPTPVLEKVRHFAVHAFFGVAINVTGLAALFALTGLSNLTSLSHLLRDWTSALNSFLASAFNTLM